jgi:NAD(P)H-flavin reductase
MNTARPRPKLLDTKVLRKTELTPDLRFIWIEKPDGFNFKAGQYCTIGRDGVERAYSIASAPHENDLELFVELVAYPEGVLTPKLWELEPGDTLSIRPRAKGIFTMNPRHANQFLVATVTGVVPYISFIRDYLYNKKIGQHFYVLYGASYVDEFAYDKELLSIAHSNPQLLTFIPTISRPDDVRNEGWLGETGRVNTIVEKYLGQQQLTPQNTLVYACGHPGMISDVKTRLLPSGFLVEEERFWKED